MRLMLLGNGKTALWLANLGTKSPVTMMLNSRRCWMPTIGSDDQALLLDLEQLTSKGGVGLRAPLATTKCFNEPGMHWGRCAPSVSVNVSVVWTR
jgi:hypothetical protein